MALFSYTYSLTATAYQEGEKRNATNLLSIEQTHNTKKWIKHILNASAALHSGKPNLERQSRHLHHGPNSIPLLVSMH